MPGGVSILMTLAPQSASWRTQVGPERTRVRSRTVKRSRALDARGKGIAGRLRFLFCALGGAPNFPDLAAVVYRLAAPSGCRSGDVNPLNSCRKWSSFRHFHEAIMNEDVLNVSVRTFLKKVGITSQREIEQAVRGA